MIETIFRLIWEWEFATGALEISKTKNFQISKVGWVEDAPEGAIVDRALAQVEVFEGGQVFALSDKFYLISIGKTATQIESRQKKELVHKFDINPQWQLWSRAFGGRQRLEVLNVAFLDGEEEFVDLDSRVFRDFKLVESSQVGDAVGELLSVWRILETYIDKDKCFKSLWGGHKLRLFAIKSRRPERSLWLRLSL